MDPLDVSLADEAARLATSLPLSLIEDLADAIGLGPPGDRTAVRNRALRSIPQPHYRGLVSEFLDRWIGLAAGPAPQSVAMALLTAARMERMHRNHQSAELVWTGPPTGLAPLRRTEQAILQVVGAATRRILIVSYVVYNIPRIGEALVSAARRGVDLTVVLETPDPQAGRGSYDTLRALGPAVSDRSRVYYWPHDRRPRDPSGRPGLLHVKCVAADSAWLFLSSANLTEYALSLNMELGALIHGGELPARVEAHFDQLMREGILDRVGITE